MKSLREKLAETGPLKTSRRMERLFRRDGVKETQELRRIVNIPRQLSEDPLEEVVDLLTAAYALPPRSDCTDRCACRGKGWMRLKPIQVRMLLAIHDYGGLLGSVRVGGGKTLPSLLVGTILDLGPGVLCIPGSQREKTDRDIQRYKRHWRIEHEPKVITYSALGIETGADLLDRIRPKWIFADECQKLKNKTAACTRRVKRWMEEHEDTIFAGVSGTVMTRTLLDCQHLLAWALPNHCPIPTQYNILVEWDLATREKLGPEQARIAPGALSLLYGESEKKIAETDELQAARRAVHRRMAETPGVVATSDVGPTMPLIVRPTWQHADRESVINEAFSKMRETYITPDGRDIGSPVEFWRHARSLKLGLVYKWDPPPPPEWMLARKMWKAACRFILKMNRRGLDSELPVWNAVRRGEYNGLIVMEEGFTKFPEPVEQIWAAWAEIKPTFKPNTVPVWIDDEPLLQVAEWMKGEPGIVWVEHTFFGHRLAEITGAPYFQQGGFNATGDFIDDYAPSGGCIIASIASNGEGRNLQAWNRNLVTSMPTTGLEWEQLLGRTHRDGSDAEEVTLDLMLGCIEDFFGWFQVIADAHFLADMTGQPQKLQIADNLVPPETEFTMPRTAAWGS